MDKETKNDNLSSPQGNNDYQAIQDQLKSLEDVFVSWHQEREKAEQRAEKRLQRFLVQLVIFGTGALGTVWTAVEMGSWYYDRLQQEKMAARYLSVANDMYEKENNPDVALQMLDNAIELDDNFETRYQKAYIKGMKSVHSLLNLDRPFNKEELNTAHQSLADAKFLIQLREERPEGYILESQIYTALKEFDNAEKSIKKALTIAPDHIFAKIRYITLLYNQKKYDEALQIISKVVETAPNDKWGHLWYGLVLDAKRKKSEALKQFELAIKLDPKFDVAIYNLGLSYMNARPRNFAKARECFQRVLKVNPAYRAAYYQLGMSYGYQDRYDVALTYMDKAIALSADYLTAQNWRALVLFEMKRFDESAAGYSTAIMLDPRNDELYVRRAAAWSALKKFDQAINDLNFALELNSQNIEAVMILSDVYLETGNFNLALEKIDSAIKAAAADKALLADLWNLRAKLWLKKSDFAAAVKDQHNAVKCYKSKFTLYYLALYQYRAKQNNEALKTLDDLHKLDGKYSNAWKLRAMLLKNSDKAAALKAVDKYLSLRPQDKSMQKLRKELSSK